jgi:hypothetical protein
MNGNTNTNSQTTVYVILKMLAAIAENKLVWFKIEKWIEFFYNYRSDTLNQVNGQLRNVYQAYVKFSFDYFFFCTFIV